MTGQCNGLCNPVDTLTKLHADENCTKLLTDDLPMMVPWYDYSQVGCIKVDDSGDINKSQCFV